MWPTTLTLSTPKPQPQVSNGMCRNWQWVSAWVMGQMCQQIWIGHTGYWPLMMMMMMIKSVRLFLEHFPQLMVSDLIIIRVTYVWWHWHVSANRLSVRPIPDRPTARGDGSYCQLWYVYVCVIVDPRQPSHSLCSLSAGFDFTGYSGDTRQVRRRCGLVVDL